MRLTFCGEMTSKMVIMLVYTQAHTYSNISSTYNNCLFQLQICKIFTIELFVNIPVVLIGY